jgi:uncharacterized protein YcsI (UPF0317 family)
VNAAVRNTILSPSELRGLSRAGKFTGPTAGHAPGFVQANVVILPSDYAEEFAEFCSLNRQPCPLFARTYGSSELLDDRGADVAPGANLWSDVPKYRVFHSGQAQSPDPTDVRHLASDDSVGFLLGCSFTFETALEEVGLTVRHIEAGSNVPMYRTSIPCLSAGRFAAPLVVSMRPYRPEQIDAVVRITARYPRMHGAPVHIGEPAAIGIGDLAHPDFGDPVEIRDGEIPVFWACGVTSQLAVLHAAPPLAITHSPGCMFVTDLKNEALIE